MFFTQHTSDNNPFHGKSWSTRIISQIINIVYQIWIKRNEVIHKKVQGNLNEIELAKLHQKIKDLYEKGPTYVQTRDRHMFDEGINRTMQRTIRDKKYWIRTIEVSMNFYNENNTNMLAGMRRIMLQWTDNSD